MPYTFRRPGLRDNICDNLEAKIRAEHLHRFLARSLTPRERQVVELRYGLCNRPPLTQRSRRPSCHLPLLCIAH